MSMSMSKGKRCETYDKDYLYCRGRDFRTTTIGCEGCSQNQTYCDKSRLWCKVKTDKAHYDDILDTVCPCSPYSKGTSYLAPNPYFVAKPRTCNCDRKTLRRKLSLIIADNALYEEIMRDKAKKRAEKKHMKECTNKHRFSFFPEETRRRKECQKICSSKSLLRKRISAFSEQQEDDTKSYNRNLAHAKPSVQNFLPSEPVKQIYEGTLKMQTSGLSTEHKKIVESQDNYVIEVDLHETKTLPMGNESRAVSSLPSSASSSSSVLSAATPKSKGLCPCRADKYPSQNRLKVKTDCDAKKCNLVSANDNSNNVKFHDEIYRELLDCDDMPKQALCKQCTTILQKEEKLKKKGVKEQMNCKCPVKTVERDNRTPRESRTPRTSQNMRERDTYRPVTRVPERYGYRSNPRGL